MSRARTIVIWVLQILCAALFVLIGTVKFVDPSWARNFERWGYPPGSHLIVGVVEIVGGIGLLVPRVSSYAAVVLMAVMVGAAVTHAIHAEIRRLIAPIVYLLVLGLIAGVRRRRRSGAAARPLATSKPFA